MRSFFLFELSRRLTHLIDTSPSSNGDLRSQGIEAVKTSVHFTVEHLWEVKGISIPEDHKLQAIQHVTNRTI